MPSVTPFFQTCQVCGAPANVHIHAARDRQWVEDHDLCEKHAQELVGRRYSGDGNNIGLPFNTVTCFDMDLLMVTKDVWDARYYLRDQNNNHHFSATLGYCESVALYLCIQNPVVPRPGTHNVLATAIEILGGHLQDVLIYGFAQTENCFLAYLRIQKGNQLLTIDVRPSDAMALAIVLNVPILVSETAWRIFERNRHL